MPMTGELSVWLTDFKFEIIISLKYFLKKTSSVVIRILFQE